MSLPIPEGIAKWYGLVDKIHIQAHSHLCPMCDLFFQHADKLKFPFDSRINTDQAPALSSKILAARDDRSPGVYPHWQSLRGLSEATERGCHVCRLFQSQLTATERDRLAKLDAKRPLMFAIKLSLDILFHRPSEPVRYKVSLICIARSISPPDPPTTVSLFHDLLMLSTDDRGCVNGAWLERDRWSSAMQTTLSWIRDCANSHPYCNSVVHKSPVRPRRLIFVGDDDSEVRLCENSDTNSIYCTLSHCWGQPGVPFRLTLENWSSLCQKIPVDRLSLTFQQAIKFTRGLKATGVRYLWIDALCIIQDSKDDWNREAPIMGDIYSNGICNLAACAGSDGSTGLVPMNDAWFSHRCVISAGPGSCLEGSFTLYNENLACHSERGLVRDESILSRAWCVQELKLSQRVVYFARHQIIWDCSTLVAKEESPRLLLDDDFYTFRSKKRNVQLTFREYHQRCIEHGVEPSIFMIYRQWMGIVWEYTRCSLTRHTDKLVAIAGLAKSMHSALGPNEQYIAGLWQRYLHLHLLWDITGTRTDFRYKEYRAPSWSWASAEGGVYNHRTNDEAAATCTSLIQATTQCQTKTNDPYSVVSSAVLEVEGPVIKASLNARGPKHQNGHLVTDATFGNGLKFSSGNPLFSVTLDFDLPGNDPIDAHCLLVIQEVHSGVSQVAGLVLMRHGSLKGQYVRIGLAFVLPCEVLQEARSCRLEDPNDYECLLASGDYKISVV